MCVSFENGLHNDKVDDGSAAVARLGQAVRAEPLMSRRNRRLPRRVPHRPFAEQDAADSIRLIFTHCSDHPLVGSWISAFAVAIVTPS